MKIRKLTLIHTSPVLIPIFTELANELLPGIDVSHVADDWLIKQAIAQGSLSAGIVERLQQHIKEAEQGGAQAIMVTCSSMGPAIEASEAMTQVPLLRVDRAMADRAVALANRIGVIATVATTLQPTADLIQRRAAAIGKTVEITATLCDGALEKLLAGDVETHDRMVTEKLSELLAQVDVIVLAQASMARVANQLGERSGKVPVLSSPRLAMEALGV